MGSQARARRSTFVRSAAAGAAQDVAPSLLLAAGPAACCCCCPCCAWNSLRPSTMASFVRRMNSSFSGCSWAAW